MQIIHTIAALRERLSAETSIAFVPTMGNLHAGHIELVSLAKQHGQCVVVSIFVNPLQFGKNEDLASYPRTLATDCEKLRASGANVVFAPDILEMYPDFNAMTTYLGQTMAITAPAIAAELCGAARPGHFDGVATVVMKLFNIVQPTTAIFGKKDFQQLLIVRELVRQFNLPIATIAANIVRENDGLAMSSRNGYLNSTERTQATLLQQTLLALVHGLQTHQTTDFRNAEQAASAQLTAQDWVVDYISVRSAISLQLMHNPLIQANTDPLIVLGAARLGKTRLIDNIEFTLN